MVLQMGVLHQSKKIDSRLIEMLDSKVLYL